MRRLLSIAVFALCGYANADSRPQAVIEYDRVLDAANAAGEEYRACRGALMGSAVGNNLVHAKIIAFDNDPDRMSILSSGAKLSPAQKKTLVAYLQANQKCQNAFLDRLGENPLSDTRRRYYETADFVYIDMLAGKLSVAEGNRKLVEARSASTRDWNAELQGLTDRANAALAAKQQRKESERQALIQSIDQSLIRIRSIDTSPSQSFTNCSQNFNNINCTTMGY